MKATKQNSETISGQEWNPKQTRAQYVAGQAVMKRLAQNGRRVWASMTAGERQALNDYAMETEGHTIN